jgi:hypothetical protein
MILDTLSVTKYIAACAQRSGMSIVWEKEERPRTDGKVMYLPMISASASPATIVKHKQFVKHETSHVIYSDFSLLEREKPAGSLMFVFNLLEDHRVDWLNDVQYEGDKRNTEAYYKLFADKCEKDAGERGDEAKDVLAPLFSWDLDYREDLWARTGDPFTSTMSAKGIEVFKKLHRADYGNVLRNIRNIDDPVDGTRATFELAKRILEEVFDIDASSCVEPPPTTGSGVKVMARVKIRVKVEQAREGMRRVMVKMVLLTSYAL